MATNQPNQVAVQNEKEKVQLGMPDVWIKRTPAGRISAVRADMVLKESQGELCFIEGKPMITADGYYRLNQVASLAIMTPDSISIPSADGDGVRRVANPYPFIDPASGTQKGVWVKKLAVGYSPIGSMVVSSTTLFYDFSLYFIADLQKKVKDNREAGRLCFEHQLTDDERAKGIFMRIEGDLGIWANTQHPDILRAVSTWIQNKQFGERKAQTVAERNALKHHPALAMKLAGIQGNKGNGAGMVTVIGWQHDHGRDELEDIARAADAGQPIEVAGRQVEVTEHTGEVSPEELMTAAEDDPDPSGNSWPDDGDRGATEAGAQEGLF